MRVSRWTLVWIIVVGVLVAVELGVYTGRITPGDLITSFFGVIFALVVISVLAIIGAVFVGTLISHRILSSQGFTPFETEMLKMRQEVRDLQERVEAIGRKIGVTPDPRTKGR